MLFEEIKMNVSTFWLKKKKKKKKSALSAAMYTSYLGPFYIVIANEQACLLFFLHIDNKDMGVSDTVSRLSNFGIYRICI